MDTKKLIEVYKDYLNTKNTTYALLLNGKWGSGKTYFWKNKLSTIAQEKKFTSIYISLNGVADINTIDELILSEILSHKFNSSNSKVKNGLFFLRNSINVGGKIFAGGAQVSDIFKDTDFNFIPEATILCFDDLERTTIEKKVILGYINEFVEHKKIKVIIIADDSKIDKKEEYSNLKEKVIGRELVYSPNIKEVFDNFLEIYNLDNDSQVFKIFENQKEFLQDIFIRYNIENLRTLKFSLDLLFNIYTCLKDIADEENFIEELTLFTVIIANEYKSGEISVEHINNRRGIDSSLYFINWKGFNDRKQSSTSNKEETYGEKFKNKYFKNGEASTYKFFDSIYEYILSGYLNCYNLKTEIGTLIEVSESPQQIALNSFAGGRFRMLSNENFKLNLNEVLKCAELGEYELSQYITIYQLAHFFIDYKVIDMDKETLIDKLKKGINLSVEKGKVNYRDIDYYNTYEGANNIIAEIVINKTLKLKEANQKNKAQSLLKILPQTNDLDEFFMDYFSEYNSIFRFLENEEFIKVFENLSNKRLMEFNYALNTAYLSRHIEYKDKEMLFFQSLKDNLNSKLESRTLGFPRSLIIEELIELIDSDKFQNKMNQKY